MIPEIADALAAVGIEHPFPIQSLAIPIALNGTDMIGQARTGTGKTLAFGVSLLQRITVKTDPEYAELRAKGKPQALVMCPTRELALQVAEDLEVASAQRKARVLTVYGGVGYDIQVGSLGTGVDVVVGTPGRLLDLVARRSLDLSAVRVLVLDEADEMLDMGFLPDVERLISKTPPTRQTLLFSATMPSAVVGLARMYLNQPVNVRAETQDASVTVPEVDQFIYQAHDLDKPEIVGRLLQADHGGRHGGAEQHRLPGRRGLRDQPLDVGQEAHVEHLVGLVQNQHPDRGQVERAPGDQVEQASGGADDHIDAAGQRADLEVVADAAVDGEHPRLTDGGRHLEIVGDLQGEFAGGAHHQRLRFALGRVIGVAGIGL